MKTVFKTMTSQKIAREKQIEFEKKTGLKWDVYHTGSGMTFTPVVINDTPVDDNIAQKLLPFLSKDYQAFVKLSDISGLSLADVLIASKTLVKNGYAMPTVNRLGHFAAIRII